MYELIYTDSVNFFKIHFIKWLPVSNQGCSEMAVSASLLRHLQGCMHSSCTDHCEQLCVDETWDGSCEIQMSLAQATEHLRDILVWCDAESVTEPEHEPGMPFKTLLESAEPQQCSWKLYKKFLVVSHTFLGALHSFQMSSDVFRIKCTSWWRMNF